MSVPGLPDDLVAALAGAGRTLEAGHYGTVSLVPPSELRVGTLEVTPNLAPFARDDPNRHANGYYAVPAVNLVRGDPRVAEDFPAWLFLWLPDERRYGSFDDDHGDLLLFAPNVRWSDIQSDPGPFVSASDGDRGGSVAVEYLRPWPRYPYVVPG